MFNEILEVLHLHRLKDKDPKVLHYAFKKFRNLHFKLQWKDMIIEQEMSWRKKPREEKTK
jgi:hypothetical protein